MTTPARSAGCRVVHLEDAEGGGVAQVVVLYPSTAPARPERLERFVVDVALEGPVAEGTFPLVVVSHGTGGSHLLYRTLAAHLARAGFVVALLEHPRNNRRDDSLARTDTILAARPRQLRLTIDRAYADAALAPHLASDSVAVVGHSLGGYTALAVAGGRPWCGPHESPDGVPHPVPVVPDARVKALVLLAPATPWYQPPDALAAVRVPILMLTGERDEATPAWHAELVKRGVPDASLVRHRVVAGAGHYSFLSPFPEALVSPAFPPSQDPAGFDRAAFHEELNEQVTEFLRLVLGRV